MAKLTLRQIVLAALNQSLGATYERTPIMADHADLHRVPSGITELDAMTGGGFYGFTIVAGPPKQGKSLIAQQSAVQGALAGWQTFYAYGEMTHGQVIQRTCNALGRSRENWPDRMANFEPFRFRRGADVEVMLRHFADQIPVYSERVLIVLDSLNRLAAHMAREQNHTHAYFRAIDRISSICQDITEFSDGRICVVALSEQNQQGGAKGGQVEYDAQCIVKLKPAKGPHCVSIHIDSRDSPGGDLGEFQRVYESCRFVRACDAYDERASEPPEFPGEPRLSGELPWD